MNAAIDLKRKGRPRAAFSCSRVTISGEAEARQALPAIDLFIAVISVRVTADPLKGQLSLDHRINQVVENRKKRPPLRRPLVFILKTIRQAEGPSQRIYDGTP